MTYRWFARLIPVLGLVVPLLLITAPVAAQDPPQEQTAEEAAAVAQAEEEGVVRLADEVDRDAVIRALRERGIDSKSYLPSIHLFPHLAELGYREGQFPVAEAASAHSLALPFFPSLSEEQIERVCTELAVAVEASVRGPGSVPG